MATNTPCISTMHDVVLVSPASMVQNTLIRNVDRRPAPGLNLSSNNPFRRAASPSPLAPQSPSTIDYKLGTTARRSPRPVSTNPFLDSYRSNNPPETFQHRQSPPKLAGPFVDQQQHHGPAELIVRITPRFTQLLWEIRSLNRPQASIFPKKGADLHE